MAVEPAPLPKAPAPRAERIVLFALVALALAVRCVHLGWGLPAVLEEAVPLKRAWDMWGFGPMRSFDPNPHWFQYPSLIFYVQLLGQALLALVLRASGAVHSWSALNLLWLANPTPMYLVGRGITALFGAATVLPVWGLARRAGGPLAAATAALLVALHPGLVAKSQVVEVDVPLVFFVTLALLRALEHADGASRRDWLVTGGIAGLAFSTKYPGLILVLPLALAAWWAPLPARARAAAAPRPRAERRRERARPERAHAAPSRFGAWLERLALGGAALAVAFVVTSPYLLLDRGEAARDLAIGRDLMAAGHFGVAGGAAYGTYARAWCTSFLGAPLGLASLAGLVLGCVRRERWALLLASLALPFALVVGSWQMKAERYLLPLVPLAAIAAGALFATLARALAPRAAAARWLVPALGALACAAPLAARLPAYWRTLGADTRNEARQWIERTLPAGSLVASELYGPELLSPLGLLVADGDVRAEIAPLTGARPIYAVQTVPMFVMAPERSAKYYALERYADADAFVVTGAIRDRYRGDPARYAAQLAFYDTLARRWPRVAHFEPHDETGSAIEIYRNPAARPPFVRTGDPAAIDSTIATTSPLTGAEGYWYMNLGLAHELAGHDRAAEACYRLALRFRATEPSEYARVALRLAALDALEGRTAEGLRVLDACARHAPGASIARSLLAARDALAAGRPIASRLHP